ncbi:YqgE/AlgH family protein [Marinobacteraceae bacterium S3BR75-40.1]
MSDSSQNLRDHFLISMPYMQDPNFSASVTYICEHNQDGAFGLVINRPLDLTVGDVFAQMDFGGEELEDPVYNGGPVQIERGFVLHRPIGQWQSSMAISRDVALTSSRDVLQAIAAEEGPDDYLFALGYAGWGAGQLEEELAGNVWLTCPADTHILFELPAESRFEAAVARLGIDINQLTNSVGHA